MPPVITFIGWHNSGKTTLMRAVLGHLKARGYAVGVIKSTKERGISVDQPQSDSGSYRIAGADRVALLAPDQLIVHGKAPSLDLLPLVQQLFADMDLVLAEGFKHTEGVAKIEVRRDPDAPWLRDQVPGVVAVATDLPCHADCCFRLDQSLDLATFVEEFLFADRRQPFPNQSPKEPKP